MAIERYRLCSRSRRKKWSHSSPPLRESRSSGCVICKPEPQVVAKFALSPAKFHRSRSSRIISLQEGNARPDPLFASGAAVRVCSTPLVPRFQLSSRGDIFLEQCPDLRGNRPMIALGVPLERRDTEVCGHILDVQRCHRLLGGYIGQSRPCSKKNVSQNKTGEPDAPRFEDLDSRLAQGRYQRRSPRRSPRSRSLPPPPPPRPPPPPPRPPPPPPSQTAATTAPTTASTAALPAVAALR